MNPELHKKLQEMGLEPSTGCWIDGHHGQYGVTRLIEIAKDYGFVTQEDDELALAAYRHGMEAFEYEGETCDAADWILNQGGLGDAAEAWLNENVAREGFSFGWHSGEFFYMNTEWWAEES